MTEGEIRQLAVMYALVADMEALKTERDGMTAGNLCRAAVNESPAYSASDFESVAIQIRDISIYLKNDI